MVTYGMTLKVALRFSQEVYDIIGRIGLVYFIDADSSLLGGVSPVLAAAN